MAKPGQLEAAMSRDRRKNFRVEWNSPGMVEVDRRPARPCMVTNISNGGAMISGVNPATLPDEFTLRLANDRKPGRKCQVAWRTKNELGVEFTDATPREREEATRRNAEMVNA
jgi:hypothetical protein